MKNESWIWMGFKVTLVIAGVTAIAVGLKYLADQTETNTQAEIDTWVNQRLIEALSRKFNQPAQVVGDTLRNPSNSPLSEQIEQTVRSVTVTFQRSSSSNFQTQLDLLYTGDTAFSTKIEKEWDELPAEIRKEFLQTGNQTVRRIWNLFPNRLSTCKETSGEPRPY
jgi:hypothetical protein